MSHWTDWKIRHGRRDLYSDLLSDEDIRSRAKTWPISQSYTSLDIVSELQLLPSLPSTFPVGNRANSEFFLVVTIYALLIPVFQFTYQRLQIQKKRGGVHFHLHYQDCREHLWSDIYQYRVKISKMTREALYSTGSYKKNTLFEKDAENWTGGYGL